MCYHLLSVDNIVIVTFNPLNPHAVIHSGHLYVSAIDRNVLDTLP